MDAPEATGKTLSLEICALDRAPFKAEVFQVIVPGAMGAFAILPGHTPLLSALDIGLLKTDFTNGERHFFAINGGVVRVLKNQVLVLTETAELDTEIDLERAESARDRAEERMRGGGGMDEARAEIALKRAIMRIRARSHGAQQNLKG